MNSRRAAAVSFSILLVATVIAWRLTVPEARWHVTPASSRQVVPPSSAAQGELASDTRGSGSRPASRRRRAQSRATSRPDRSSSRPSPLIIKGRVVTHDNREPAAGANVRVTYSDEDGPVMAAHGAADRDGMFAILLPGPEPETVALEISSEKGFGREDYHVFGPYRGTVDVGDVELSTMNIVWFHVQAPDGVPVAGALAHPTPGGTFVARADADGNGRLESNVPMKSIRFVAPGFELADVPLPLGEDSLKVVLKPGISVTIRVTTGAGPPNPESTWVEVEADPFPCAVKPGDPLWQALENSTLTGRTGRTRLGETPRPGERWSFRASTIRLAPIRPGTSLSIWATQDLKVRQVEQEVQLTAPESRVVDLVLPGSFGRLSGRVVDATGSPVCGAALQLGRAASQFWEIQRLTDEDGAFDFGALPVGNTDLRVSSTKHAYWHAPEHEVAADSRPLTIRLEAGTQVIVKVVDSQGRPAVGADVHALDRFATTDAEGQAVIPHLPLGRVNIDVVFEGAREVVQHETAISTVTITLGTSPR